MLPNESSFRKYRVYADFRDGSPGRGRQMGVGSSTTAIFGDFAGYFFGNVTDKTIYTTRRYASHDIRSKMNNLECLFHVKIRVRTAHALSRAYLSVS